jgi:GMP synthase-like glutamine amidotransferase
MWDGPSTVWAPALDPDGPSPRSAEPFAAVVLLGSRASVHDDGPWIRRLRDVLGPIVSGDVDRPFLGVCYGHQWLAHEAGGTVGVAIPDGSKIVGVADTRFQGGRLLPEGRVLRVIVSHREAVTRIPERFLVTATRTDCAIDALEHAERPLFGVQFHPEARDDFARSAGFDPALIDERVRSDSAAVLRAFLGLA